MTPIAGPASTDREQLVPGQLAGREDEDRLREMRVRADHDDPVIDPDFSRLAAGDQGAPWPFPASLMRRRRAGLPVQGEDADAYVGFREPIGRDTGVVVVVEQSESADHRCEKSLGVPFVKTVAVPRVVVSAIGRAGLGDDGFEPA